MAVKRSEWVKKVKADPSSTAQLVVVDGYIGDSPQSDHVRIYLDSRLTRYVDVPETAVRHQEDIAGSTPAGAQRIWLDPDAEIKTAPQTMTAKFLEGSVARTYASRAQSQQTARGRTAQGEPVPWLTDFRINCPPRTIPGVDCPDELSLVAETSICCPYTIPEAICTQFDAACGVVEFTVLPKTKCCPPPTPNCPTFEEISCLPRDICRSDIIPFCTHTVPCEEITVESVCGICITENPLTICECDFTVDFRCELQRPTPFTITDPFQLNRMAQLQRARRRAIGRRGLSRF